MRAECEREIHELHAFFEAWFRGDAPNAEFERVARALAPDFQLVSPRGQVDDQNAILAAIRAARGGRSAAFEIRIEAVEARYESESSCLMFYEEHQHDPERGSTVRLSSALFRRAEDTPRGVEWVHLHETWRGP